MFKTAIKDLNERSLERDNDHYQIVSIRDPKLVAMLEVLGEIRQKSVTNLFAEKFSEELAAFIVSSKEHIPAVEKAFKNKVGVDSLGRYEDCIAILFNTAVGSYFSESLKKED